MSSEETMLGEDSEDALGGSPSMEETMAADDARARQRRRHNRRSNTTPEHGTLIGRYVVLSRLGAGAMGVVISAYDPQLDRKVAIKLLRSRYGDHSTEQARLQREAQALARLNHPNVVGVHDIGVYEGRVFVAMEFVKGRTLRQWLEKSEPRPAWPEIVRVFEEAGRGLAAAHAQDLVHRDFKPENVMIGDDDRVRVMDFGLVRATASNTGEREELESFDIDAEDSMDSRLTRVGALMGTPAYMAPEQYMHAEVDARTDQFAFCVALYEALYEERPFEGESVADLASAVISGAYQDPPRRTEVPTWLRQLVNKGLAHEPSNRFASMDHLLEALGAIGVRRRRRRWALVGVGVVAAGASVWGVQRYDEAREIAGCEQAGGAIEESWNEDVRVAVRDGLEATEVVYAPVMAERVMPWLDGYAEEWREHRTEVCIQGQVREAWTPETVDKAVWCLEGRRDRFDVLIDTLVHADVRTVQSAVAYASSLSSPSPCIDERSLSVAPTPPAQEIRSRVAEVMKQLGRAVERNTHGDHEAATQIVRDAREEAETLGWPTLGVWVMIYESKSLERQGKYLEAEEVAVRAYFEAVRTEVWDTAAMMATNLIYLVGVQQARHGEGMLWAQHAQSAIVKAGDPMGIDEAMRVFNVGTLHYEKGEYELARSSYQRARELRQEAMGPEHPSIASVDSSLGNVYGKLGQDEEAKRLKLRALAIHRENLGPDHPLVAASLINLGPILVKLEDYDAAKQRYNEALKTIERTLGPEHPYLALNLNNLAHLHLSLGEYAEAQPLYERAVALKEKVFGAKHPKLLSSLTGLGETLSGRGQYGPAIVLFERALALEIPERDARDIADDRMLLAGVLWQAPVAEGGDRERAHSIMEQIRGESTKDETMSELHDKAVEWLAEHPIVESSESEQPPADSPVVEVQPPSPEPAPSP